MSITLDDDFDYTIDERRDAEDDGPALRPGYAPPPSLGEGTATFGAETAGNDSEPFLTLRDRSQSTIDWNRFIRPATPEEIKAYDEWEAQRAKQGMGAVISQVFQDRRQAWEQTPDQAAHRMWLEQQTGIPQRMMKDGDVLRTAEMRAQMGMDALTLHDAPEQVVSWLKTPGMLEIARDDLETLKKVGDALQQLAASKAPTRPGNKWKDFRSGIADALEGKADVREMQAAARMSPSVLEPEGDVGTSSGVMGLGRGFLASLPKEVRKDVAASMSRAALSNADEWRSWAEWVRPDPYVLPKEGTFSRWLSDVVRGTPYTLTGMPVSAALTTGGAVLGGPLGATAGAALSSLIQTNGEAQLEQAHVWRELVDRGMDPAEAYDKSFNEVYLPNFGLLYLSNFLQDRLTFGVPMGRGAAYWVKRGGNLLLSSLFEGGEEIGQSLISNRALGEENDWGQLLYEGAVGVGVGLVFSGGGTALGTAMGQYREHRAEAGEARESTRIGAVMDEAVKAAEASRVRERSPEAFDDFVEYVGGQGQEKVNVDGAVFFQTFGEDAYAAAERLGIGDGLDEAARTGGAMEIPTAAILKNPDIYEKVKNDLRYSDDGMSRNEAQEYERTRDERNRADIDAAASAMRTVQEAGEKAERIRDGLRTQFEALGHKKVGRREAEFYSTIWTAAIANEARYAGVDIEEMARRPEWNLRFQYDRGTGDISRMRDVYTHPVNAGVDLGQKVPILDLSGKIPDAQQVTPQELLDFLKAEFVGKEPSISADGEAMIGLPSNSAAKHVVRSSWKGLTYEDMDTRTAGLMSLRDVLQNATLIESSPNQKSSKTHLKNIHRFYIPVWSSDGLKTLRIVAHESKNSDGRTPVEVDLNDLIVERQNEGPARLSGTPLSGVLPERQLRGASEVTIADMLRGVKDAEGRPYVGEEYQQSSVRQSEDYDYSDPKTWPEGPGRDEALMLETWQNFEPDGEIETWPESPEKTEALALWEEYGEIETWVENLSREEFDRMLWSDDPEFVRKNERGEEIENRLRVLARRLRKKKPKGAEGRLLQLIEAEEEAAVREAEEYYQIIGKRGAEALDAAEEGTTRLDNLNVVREMEQADKDARAIRLATGWERGADGKWRHEIPDGAFRREGFISNPDLLEFRELEKKFIDGALTEEEQARLKELEPVARQVRKPSRLSDFYDSPELYAAYPELADISVKFQDRYGEGKGSYSPSENTILLDTGLRGDAAKTVLVHEIQHAIQNIEGFASGGNLEKGGERYHRLAGETEARNAERRTLLTDKERKERLLSETEDVAREDQIVLGEMLEMEMAYYPHQADEKLAQDEKAWATLIDRFLDNELSGKEKGAPLPVMTTPLVLSLTGVEVLPVEIHARNLDKILNGKHEIAPETLKQLPRAIADPIMIFRSPADESKGRDSRVILTELTEKDAGGEDRSIVAAITLKRANTRHGYEINELTTVFRKDVSSRQNLTPELDVLDWMTRRHKDGSPMNLLLYLNRNKGLEWLDRTGTSPKAYSLFQDPYVQSVPNEADLDNLRGTAPGFYQDADMPLGSTRFEDAKTIVSILKDGNRSTFLHELGHVFLNSRRNLALMEGIDETVRQDWTTLVEWLEVADIDFSKPLSEADEKRWRNAHEKFAAGFEKYLMEGKAPSLDLARAFRAFRKWLTDIYRAVRNVFYVDADGNRVEFEINDEIRGVMDRMLASEEEIAQATEARQLGEARKKLLEAGIPDDFVKEYEEAVWAATDASERQLFRILEGETSRDYRDRMKELRAQLTAEAREETAKVPRYRTAAFMREKGIKLSLKDLTDRYGLAATQDLPKGTAHVGGLQLDVAAEMLGYENADLLVEDLKAVKEVPFNEAVRRAVDESMRREESLLHNPEALRNAVDEALHVDERLAEILRRRELVMEKLGRNPRDEATRRTEGAATLAAVKEQAREIVQGKKIGAAASVRKWHTAELRSRSRALQSLDRARKALAEEDTPKASAALKDAREHLDMEALNHALVQEAMKARDEIEAGKRYTRRLWKNRKRLEAAVGEENWAQVRGLMERFGFWRVENPEKSRHKAPLAEWADKLEVGGALLPDLVLQDGVGFDSPALMTFSQFSDLIQAVRTIEHVGRNERTLIIDGRRRERQALKERLIAEKVEHYGDLPPMDTDPNEGSGRLAGAKRLFLKYFSDLTAVEFMMRQMDKHKPLGSWWEAIFKPVSDAELREIEMKREMVSKVRELFARFPDAGAGLKEKVVTRLYNPRKSDYTPFTRENLLALALNMGTERNRQRVLGGWFPKLDMTDERAVQEAMGIVDSLLENLTDTDWEFVQGVWDLFDGYWPQVAALEKEVSGVTPEKERAVPVRTASGKVMRGGYFPIRYNPVKNLTAAKHQAEKLEKSLHETPYGRAAVAHGYTKGRMEVVNRQILFKLDTIAMHLNEVAHDLTHRMAVRDVSRLINDKELSAHLEHVLGRENYEQLNPWLQHIANSALSEKDVTAVDKMVRRGMSNIAAAYMGFKVSVGLKQIVGLGPAADQVGRLRLSKAMMQYLAAYDKEAIRDEIFAKSTYMSDRANNFDRDIRGALSERTASTFSNREAGVRNMMFWWAGYMDTLVSIPTWLAAYHKALNDFAKETQDSTALEAKAVEYADMVVRTTQNAGSPKDLAAIQRGGAMRNLFTMFYTGIGRLYNLTREEWHKGHGIRDIPRLTGHVLTVYTIPFLVGELLMNRAFGSGDDDDDSLLARLWWAGKGTLGEMMAPLVFVRDVANLFVTDYRYRATPLDEIGGSIERLVRMSRRSMDEDKEMDWTKFAKESTNAAGGLLGLPSRQIIATIRGIDNAIDKWDERGPWERLFGTPMDILMGPVKEKR